MNALDPLTQCFKINLGGLEEFLNDCIIDCASSEIPHCHVVDKVSEVREVNPALSRTEPMNRVRLLGFVEENHEAGITQRHGQGTQGTKPGGGVATPELPDGSREPRVATV